MHDEVYRPEAHPAACWFIGGFVAVLGGLFVVSGVDRVAYDPVWLIPQILFGCALVFLGWRISQYYKRDAVTLTGSAMELRPFWSWKKTIPYSEIQALGFYEQDNRAKEYISNPAGRPTRQIVTSQHLVLTLKSGKVRKITLPRYDSTQLIETLQKRSGVKYQRLERQFAG